MFYLVLITPLVVLAFLVVMQLFETWLLGEPERPRASRAGASRGRRGP
jgi:hypothetical protein